jgi:catechol 2,3-dioxygenase-like lactoylglutathione lyase family enzyme
MIRVHEIISGSEPLSSQRITLDRIDRVRLAACDLRRSISFYARVFGFRATGTQQHGIHRSAAMTATAAAKLEIHEMTGSSVPIPNTLQRWGFVVTDLDWTRQAVWDLGIDIANESGEPDQIYRRQNGRSLYIRDPDSNVIELVEPAT